jgi:PTH1 family peptidyl-tRNA hydrolase
MIPKAISRMFSSRAREARETSLTTDMKYLIVGLGNIGPKYADTRHNIGFMTADRLASDAGANFESCRYGDMARFRVKNKQLMVLKPSTFMNLSGVAVRYWMNKERLPLQNLLVIVDDLALPFGAIRLRGSGSDAGHNGLKNIASELGNQNYARLRFGIGNGFQRGGQIDYVLGKFPAEEAARLPERLEVAAEAARTYCLSGLSFAMTNFNNK